MKTNNRGCGLALCGALVGFVPAVIIGAVVTWLAWDIKAHNAALVAGMVVFLAVLWLGGWIGIILQDTGGGCEEENYLSPTANLSLDTAPEPSDGRKTGENGGVGAK